MPNKIIHVIPNTGVVATGFLTGTALPWVVDHFFQEKQKASNFLILAPLQNRIKAISFTNKLIWTSAGLGTLVIGVFTGRFCTPINIGLVFLAGGFTLGSKVLLSRQPFSYSKVDDLIPALVKKFPYTIRYDDPSYDHELNLSDHIHALRALNSTELRNFVEKMHREILVLHNCELTDADVKRFAEAGWFNRFDSINLSFNPKLTDASIKWIAQNWTPDSSKNLGGLNLSKTDITDNGLKLLAEAGKFHQLGKLVIRNNPQITGEGLAVLGKCKTLKLQMLDVGGNPQLLSDQELGKWIREDGFNSLKALGLCRCNMTTETFEKMIDQDNWFKKLEGLDVRFNPKLNFSSKIAEMVNIGKFTENGRYHITYRSYSRGIFCKSCCFCPLTSEFRKFLEEHKATGSSNLMDLWDLEISEDLRK